MVDWVLGIDVGKKKTGVAVGQSITQQAKPLDILYINIKQLSAAHFESVIKEWRITQVVIGWPSLRDGKKHPLANDIQRIADEIQLCFNLQVAFVDEYLTSHVGQQELGAGKAVDSYAAKIMIEDFFNARS